MMNLPWWIGSPLIFGAPELSPFVDPRFEAQPRRFLLDAIAAQNDDRALDGLIARHEPTWIFAEHCRPHLRARLVHLHRRRGWVVTYVDAQILVLVRRTPVTEAYLGRRSLRAPEGEPRDLVPAPPGLRAQQRACYAAMLDALAFVEESARQRRLGAQEARGDAIATAEIAAIAAGR
jgi:hypothetical protein